MTARLLELHRRSPRLGSLVLTELGINKLDDDDDKEDPSVVELAHLQCLRLESLEINMWLLGHIHIPSQAPIVHHMEDIFVEHDVDDSKGWGNTLLDISTDLRRLTFGRDRHHMPIFISFRSE